MSGGAVLRAGPQGAQPVVLVHGAWHGAWCWQGNYLDAFAQAGFATLAPDLRGHGAGADGRSMLRHRVRHYADDIEHVIAGLDRPPVVIGHSLGGFVVQHLMARGLGMRGVGLLASVPPGGALGAMLASIRHNPLGFTKANLKLSLYPLVEDPDRAAALFLGGDLGAEAGHAFATRLQDESFTAFLDMLLLALPKRPARAYPVAVVGGARDSIISVASQKRMARRLGAQVCQILDAPHNVMMGCTGAQSAKVFVDWAQDLPAM